MISSYQEFFFLSQFFAIFFQLPSSIQCLPISSHGQYCNETLPCASSALLTCQDSTCQCILPDSMVFIPLTRTGEVSHPTSGHCVSLVDEACGQMSMDTSEVALRCVDSAFCNSHGECQCHVGYFKSEEALCHSQRGFGQYCNSSPQCSQVHGLACVNQTCQCNSTVSIDSLKFFDEDDHSNDKHRCLGRLGQPCLNGHCVPNAICKGEADPLENRKAVSAPRNICICQSGFEESKNKKVCVGTFNKTCDTQSNRFCQKDLSCMKGLCGCKYPSDQIYDKQSKTCVSLVGGPCPSSRACVPNANCKPFISPSSTNVVEPWSSNHIDDDKLDEEGDGLRQSTLFEYCECSEGFVENVNRTCDVAFGHACSQILDEWKCDTLTGLTCRDGFCSCPSPGQTFDMDSMKCKSLIGSFCNRHIQGECIKNAHCKPHRNGFLPFGQCECDEDYEIGADRTCSCQYCSDK